MIQILFGAVSVRCHRVRGRVAALGMLAFGCSDDAPASSSEPACETTPAGCPGGPGGSGAGVGGGAGAPVGGTGGGTAGAGGNGMLGAGGGVAPGTGGAEAAGGSSGAGGSPAAGGASVGSGGRSAAGCALPPAGVCTSPEVRITEVDLGTTVIGNGREGDTQPIPMAIAPMPGGGSRLAWLSSHTTNGSSANTTVHVAELDCEDRLVGAPFTFEAYDFTDVAADAEGGVLLLTRDAEGAGDQHCGDVNNLCVLPPDRPGCYDMYVVRFDNAGNELWATKLTTANSGDPPYTAGAGANHFIWWYQHRGRLAYDGMNYAAYFCDAITIRNGSCVDIHEGDRMKVVGPDGAILPGHDSFDGGCSHSWNVRMVWDDRSGHFVMVCATDNPRAGEHRIARPAPYRTVWPSPGPDGSLSMGDIVLGTGGGYWITASAGGSLHLLHFSDALYDQDVPLGSQDFSHLVSYGDAHMIAAWESGSGIQAEVHDRSDGSLVGSTFSIDVTDHRYQAFKAFPDGSVAYPAQGPNDHTVRIARVLPCSG